MINCLNAAEILPVFADVTDKQLLFLHIAIVNNYSLVN